MCLHHVKILFNKRVLIVTQLEVDGSLTTRVLDNLMSQTEYALAVTPIYDERTGQPMLGDAVTGKNDDYYQYCCDNVDVGSH